MSYSAFNPWATEDPILYSNEDVFSMFTNADDNDFTTPSTVTDLSSGADKTTTDDIGASTSSSTILSETASVAKSSLSPNSSNIVELSTNDAVYSGDSSLFPDFNSSDLSLFPDLNSSDFNSFPGFDSGNPTLFPDFTNDDIDSPVTFQEATVNPSLLSLEPTTANGLDESDADNELFTLEISDSEADDVDVDRDGAVVEISDSEEIDVSADVDNGDESGPEDEADTENSYLARPHTGGKSLPGYGGKSLPGYGGKRLPGYGGKSLEALAKYFGKAPTLDEDNESAVAEDSENDEPADDDLDPDYDETVNDDNDSANDDELDPDYEEAANNANDGTVNDANDFATDEPDLTRSLSGGKSLPGFGRGKSVGGMRGFLYEPAVSAEKEVIYSSIENDLLPVSKNDDDNESEGLPVKTTTRNDDNESEGHSVKATTSHNDNESERPPVKPMMMMFPGSKPPKIYKKSMPVKNLDSRNSSAGKAKALSWSIPESQACLKIMKTLNADSRFVYKEVRFDECSRRMWDDYGFDRSNKAVKFQWTRHIRPEYGIDDRSDRKRVSSLATSLLSSAKSSAAKRGKTASKPVSPPKSSSDPRNKRKVIELDDEEDSDPVFDRSRHQKKKLKQKKEEPKQEKKIKDRDERKTEKKVVKKVSKVQNSVEEKKVKEKFKDIIDQVTASAGGKTQDEVDHEIAVAFSMEENRSTRLRNNRGFC